VLRPALAAALLALLLPAALPAVADTPAPDLLPSLAPSADVLRDLDLVRDPSTGHILLRFSNAVANTGQGPVVVLGQRSRAEAQHADPANDVMPAVERVSRADGTFHDEPVGQLVYHPAHKHFHFDGAATYRLLDPDSGAVLVESPKVSFCLADVIVADDTLPGAPTAPRFNSCAHNARATRVTMGVSVGWADVYDKRLEGQAFDVSALMQQPPKWYTLESTTNPDGLLIEAHQGDPQVVRVQVYIGEGVKLGVGKSRPGV
jgi:hypothetical protein